MILAQKVWGIFLKTSKTVGKLKKNQKLRFQVDSACNSGLWGTFQYFSPHSVQENQKLAFIDFGNVRGNRSKKEKIAFSVQFWAVQGHEEMPLILKV